LLALALASLAALKVVPKKLSIPANAASTPGIALVRSKLADVKVTSLLNLFSNFCTALEKLTCCSDTSLLRLVNPEIVNSFSKSSRDFEMFSPDFCKALAASKAACSSAAFCSPKVAPIIAPAPPPIAAPIAAPIGPPNTKPRPAPAPAPAPNPDMPPSRAPLDLAPSAVVLPLKPAISSCFPNNESAIALPAISPIILPITAPPAAAPTPAAAVPPTPPKALTLPAKPNLNLFATSNLSPAPLAAPGILPKAFPRVLPMFPNSRPRP